MSQSCFRLIDYNYCAQDSVALTPSSEDISFPADNIKKAIRSKVWRSTGFFEITASNNKIDFNIGGPSLVAVITPGKYSTTQLETLIQNAMAVISGGSFAVQRSTATGKWTLTKNAGTFSLLALTGANNATSILGDLGFDETVDYTGSLAYTGARVAIHTSESVLIDIKTTENIDSFAMVFDPIAGNKISSAGVIKLQANATPNFDSPALSVTLSFDEDRGILTHYFTSPQNYRYWRVQVIDPMNSYLYIELPKLILGLDSGLARCPSNGFGFAINDQSKVQENDYGHQYSDIYPTRKSMSLDLSVFQTADMDKLIAAFERVGKTEPVFIAVDPLEEMFDKDRFSLYCRFEGDLGFKHQVIDYFNATLKFLEVM